MPRNIIDVFNAIYVPLAWAFPMGHIQRERLGIAGIMRYTSREDIRGLQIPLRGARVFSNIIIKYRCHLASYRPSWVPTVSSVLYLLRVKYVSPTRF